MTRTDMLKIANGAILAAWQLNPDAGYISRAREALMDEGVDKKTADEVARQAAFEFVRNGGPK